MLASFRRTFMPTDEERARDRAKLAEIHARAVSGRWCSACVFSHLEGDGHNTWTECEVTGEDVTYDEGRDCWTEQGLPEDAAL